MFRSLRLIGLGLIVGLVCSSSPGMRGTADELRDSVLEDLEKRGFLVTLNVIVAPASRRVCDQDIVRLPELRSLGHLGLSGTLVSDHGVKTLATMQIRSLDLHRTRITDDCLPALARIDRLRRLNLGETQVTSVGLRALAKHPTLGELYLEGTKINDEGVVELETVPLYWLVLSRTKITDSAAKHLGSHANLRRLEVSQTGAGDEVARAASRLQYLEYFSCASTEVGDAGFAAFRGHETLVTLIADHTKITDRSLAICPKMGNLGHLSFAGCRITSKGLAPLIDCKELAVLNLSDTLVEGNPFEVLAPLPHRLCRLELDGLKLAPQAYKDLARCKTLTEISLNRSPVPEADVQALWALPYLCCLSLSECPQIGDDAFTNCEKAKTFCCLNAAKTGITDLGVSRLAQLPKLYELDLSNTRITDRAFQHLAKMEELHRVVLIGTSVSRRAVAAFKEVKPDVEVAVE